LKPIDINGHLPPRRRYCDTTAPTAYDRPDKKANILSECIKILSFIKNDKHIDSDLFALFLTSRMYKAYAELCRFVDQIHDVDIARSVS